MYVRDGCLRRKSSRVGHIKGGWPRVGAPGSDSNALLKGRTNSNAMLKGQTNPCKVAQRQRKQSRAHNAQSQGLCNMTARRIGGRQFAQVCPGAFLKRRRARLLLLYVCIYVFIIKDDYTTALRTTTRGWQRRPRRVWVVSLALLVFLACVPCVDVTRTEGAVHVNLCG